MESGPPGVMTINWSRLESNDIRLQSSYASSLLENSLSNSWAARDVHPTSSASAPRLLVSAVSGERGKHWFCQVTDMGVAVFLVFRKRHWL